MESKAVVRFLMLKGFNTPGIHSELGPVYREEVFTLSTISKWCANCLGRRIELFNHLRSGRLQKIHRAAPISSMPKERPFLRCKLLARDFQVAKATCLLILQEKLGLQRLHLPRGPQRVDSSESRNHVTLSRSLLELLL
jgi:hypothetical protein